MMIAVKLMQILFIPYTFKTVMIMIPVKKAGLGQLTQTGSDVRFIEIAFKKAG